jgi:hypothetical protein
MVDERHDLEAERRLGAHEAEVFDRQLRDLESDERSSRLAGLSLETSDPTSEGIAGGALSPSAASAAGAAGVRGVPLAEFAGENDAQRLADDDYTLDRPSLYALGLRSEVERLTVYYNAVQNSRVWRLAQHLRRLVGRAW